MFQIPELMEYAAGHILIRWTTVVPGVTDMIQPMQELVLIVLQVLNDPHLVAVIPGNEDPVPNHLTVQGD